MLKVPRVRALVVAVCLTQCTVSVGWSQQASAGSPVVTADWLSTRLEDPNLVLLQVGERADYEKGHLPGARFVSLRDLSAVPRDSSALTLEMPPASELRTALEKLGISDGSHVVVVFSSGWVTPATRVIYTLAYAGLGDRTALLDGGVDAWRRAGLPFTAEVPSVSPGKLTRSAVPSLVVDNAYVQAERKASRIRLVDGRAPVFYDGPKHGNMPGGHIPGAVNIPFSTLVDDSLELLPAAKLEERFRAAGIQPGDTVVAYCHIGQQATLVLFTARLLGHPVHLYDGSFEDWSRRHLPIEGGR